MLVVVAACSVCDAVDCSLVVHVTMSMVVDDSVFPLPAVVLDSSVPGSV